MSTASGPLIGGFPSRKFRVAVYFYINVPVGIVAVIMTLTFVNETPSYGQHERIDFAGMLFPVSVFFFNLRFDYQEGHPHWSWMDIRIGGWIIAGFILIALSSGPKAESNSP